MNNSKKLAGFISAAFAFSLFVTGCSTVADSNSSADSIVSEETAASVSTDTDNETDTSADELTNTSTANTAQSDLFSDRDLNPEYDENEQTVEKVLIEISDDLPDDESSGSESE